ncbi:ATPase [Paenibacillus pectinilyticus]|uniref:ATPase n=1 Tax=Paenibacillus pectinilyticus TaxID=512399 RepID=A0A1C1A065_9BACL|nr:SRPBCC family protein [Paenibacillus pectinilyticus]OCT13681.1 ATPase [Paenibacillus pectinilyticus]
MIKHEAVLTYEPQGQQICVTRVFDAPRELVFKAFTVADLIVQWLGPRALTMKLETFEPRSGGNWRYIHADSQGNEYAFRGVYHEVTVPERIIQTFEFEGLPEKGHVVLETASFEELTGGQTRLRMESVFQSVADRDGMLHSGMEQGIQDSYERLAELLERMK